jgi:hypothetical protein
MSNGHSCVSQQQSMQRGKLCHNWGLIGSHIFTDETFVAIMRCHFFMPTVNAWLFCLVCAMHNYVTRKRGQRTQKMRPALQIGIEWHFLIYGVTNNMWIDATKAHPKQTVNFWNNKRISKSQMAHAFSPKSPKCKHQFIFHPYPIRSALNGTIFKNRIKQQRWYDVRVEKSNCGRENKQIKKSEHNVCVVFERVILASYRTRRAERERRVCLSESAFLLLLFFFISDGFCAEASWQVQPRV